MIVLSNDVGEWIVVDKMGVHGYGIVYAIKLVVGKQQIISQIMDCCCPANKQPDYGVYVNNFQSTRISSAKNKFSFRTTAVGSQHRSKQSNRSQDLNSDRDGEFDDELGHLEREYQRLKKEEEEIEYFERNRVKQLEDEVTYYQREIQQRSKDIEQLNYLFRVRMQQRRALFGRPQIIQAPNWNKNTVVVNDSTSYSSVPGNL